LVGTKIAKTSFITLTYFSKNKSIEEVLAEWWQGLALGDKEDYDMQG
jgi:hypothetical protein